MSGAVVDSGRGKLLSRPAMGQSAPVYLLSSLIGFAFGSVMNMVAYRSAAPVVVAALFFSAGAALLRLPRIGGDYERSAFRLIFAVCLFWAGVAAIYAGYFNDRNQLTSDAAGLFALASGEAGDLPLDDITRLTVGAGAVVLWRSAYNLFAAGGFEKGQYIGITLNIVLVSMTGVIGVKMVKLVFGRDAARLHLFVVLFSLCGMFWLFASLHLRDSALFIVFSALTFYWVQYLSSSHIANLACLVGASVGAFLLFAILRIQFALIPVAMTAAGVAAMVIGSSPTHKQQRWGLVTVAIVAVLAVVLFVLLPQDLFDTIVRGKEMYAEVASEAADGGSLGNQLVNAPLLARLVLGAAYILIFPVPVWSGLQEGTAYHLFKTFHALFMYGLIPLLALATWRVVKRKEVRTAPVLYLLFVAIGLTLAVAGTSMETRHSGVFLVPALVLATLPNLTDRAECESYRRLSVLFACLVFLIHLAWLVLKVL
jgi:hypothetical protein